MERRDALLILNHMAYLKTARMKELLSFFQNDPLALLQERDSFFLENNAKWFVRKRGQIDFDSFLTSIERSLKESGTYVVLFGDENYPSLLSEIYDPPLALFYKGSINNCSAKKVALVGSRAAREHSLKFTRDLARELSRLGFIIVSGMARGIDSAAHKGALEGGSPTIAVLGSGINNIYPKENKKLFSEIFSQGAVMSEFDFNAQPLATHFPVRNRIVSGMADATIVIEAKKRSGSLITARLTIENNRDLFAVPGRPADKNSEGTNELIKDGAFVVTCAEDICNHFGIKADKFDLKAEDLKDVNSDEKNVYKIVERSGKIDFDSLSDSYDGEESISLILLKMELKGLLRKNPGNCWTLK